MTPAHLVAKTGSGSGSGRSLSELQARLAERMAAHAANADECRDRFRGGTPFPHLVIVDFLPEEIARELSDTFPGPDASLWTKLPTADQRNKLATTDEGQIPALHRYVLFNLNSGTFLRFLERVTGISGLIADTHLVGGGLHQITCGGKLSVHIDYSHHPQNDLFRRLNVLLYLNSGWREEYGGDLELWDGKHSRCEKRIAPIFNRVAIFATSDTSYHGHPEPLRTPDHVTRKALSLYYFTKDPPAGSESVKHNTSFKSRPGEPVDFGSFVLRVASSGLFRDAMPPIVYKGLRKLWNRRFTGK